MGKEQKRADYEVGYGKPPISTRFKRGKSGNPAGRPKGASSVSAIVQKHLAEKLDVIENGRPRRMSKLEVVIKTVLAKAAKGDVRATEMLIKLCQKAEGDAASRPQVQELTEGDDSIIDRYLALRREGSSHGKPQ